MLYPFCARHSRDVGYDGRARAFTHRGIMGTCKPTVAYFKHLCCNLGVDMCMVYVSSIPHDVGCAIRMVTMI